MESATLSHPDSGRGLSSRLRAVPVRVWERAGLAVLPCYLADEEPTLQRVSAPEPPKEDLWLTVHRDLRDTPRVRALMDGVIAAAHRDARRLAGA